MTEWELIAESAKAEVQQDWNLLLGAASAFVGALVGCALFGWWLATRFNHMYAYINKEVRLVTQRIEHGEALWSTKLEAHERLDSERFDEMRDRMTKQDIAIARIEMFVGKSPYQT